MDIVDDKALFRVGQDVNFALPRGQGLRPTNDAFKATAKSLGIPAALARRAWYFYSFDTTGA